MPAAPLPANEDERLDALAEYEILDTPPEEALDDLARLAAGICGTPMSLVSLVELRRQFFKSHVGLDVCETPRELSFCAHALFSDDLLIVEDATRDPRFADNELVTGEMNLRFYAGAPLLTPKGHILGTLCVLDVEPRSIDRNQEKALRALARAVVDQFELRRQLKEIRQREAELAEARDRALEASRLKTRFLATMSHELRAPLTSILGFSQILLKGGSDPLTADQEDCVRHISDSGQRLLSMINDLLDLSKIEAGKAEIRLETFAVEKVAEQVVGALGPLAEEKGLALSTEIASALPPVQADPGRVRQVLLNLLSNAIKFTDEGSITVRIRRGDAQNSDGGMVEIAVEDTGIGIAPESQELIFAEFHQVVGQDDGLKGTGLGLALCRDLVALMRGEIRVESTLGEGSVFTFTLPLAPEHRGA